MSRAIPPREPIGDYFTGIIVESNGRHALAVQPIAGASTIAEGTFVLRYGIRFLGRFHQAIVPGLIALDYGDILTGEAAWSFLLERSNRFPRADVIGYMQDGSDEMAVVKALDVATPPMVLAYADAATTKPLAEIEALVGSDKNALPQRTSHYISYYTSISEWQPNR